MMSRHLLLNILSALYIHTALPFPMSRQGETDKGRKGHFEIGHGCSVFQFSFWQRKKEKEKDRFLRFPERFGTRFEYYLFRLEI